MYFKKLLFIILFLPLTSIAEEYSIIVNIDNNFSGNIKNYFLLKKRKWPNKKLVEPFDVLTEDDLDMAIARSVFIRRQLEFSSASSYIEYWIQQKSKGKTKKPLALRSFQDVLRFVKNEKGGVGFIPSRLVEGVKVISIFNLNN